MTILIPVAFIALTAFLLAKRLYPQAVLLLLGLSMLTLSIFLESDGIQLKQTTGSDFFDLFQLITEIFASKLSAVGLMIMAIGGFVAVMKEIGASQALVRLAMTPISALRKQPYLASVFVIPIGQFLFMCTPSASGLSLLLMASIYPLLIQLGISRLSACSVITACTVFDLGPASANTNQAAQIVNMTAVDYFLNNQLPVVIPLTLLLMVLYFFINRRADKHKTEDPNQLAQDEHDLHHDHEEEESKAPAIFALLPVFPLILLIVFSEFFRIFEPPIILTTTTAIILSFFVALAFEGIRARDANRMLALFKVFFKGMAKVFVSVVSLIIAAEYFASGLIQLGFIDDLVRIAKSLGAGLDGVTVVMSSLIYGSSMLLGSGNASFFAFSPLVPSIAEQVGGQSVDMILPMQLASSMGRATSPIAGLIIATSQLAGLNSFQLAHRNLLPLSLALVVLLILTIFL